MGIRGYQPVLWDLVHTLSQLLSFQSLPYLYYASLVIYIKVIHADG